MSKLIKVVLTGLMIYLLVGSAIGATQKEKIVMTYATRQETMTFDPAKNADETQCACIANTYDTLIRVLKAGGPVVPWLAESWDISKDGKTYTFHLRKGVLFHDGTELTAEDIAFSMDRMLRIKRGFFWIWADLLDPGDVKAIDKYTVAFPLKEAFGPFVTSLVQFAIVNKDLILAKKKEMLPIMKCLHEMSD